MNKKLVWGIVVLAVVIVVEFAIYMTQEWNKEKARRANLPPYETLIPNPSGSPSAMYDYVRTVDELIPSSWNTYANSEYAFSVRYPADWKIKESDVSMFTHFDIQSPKRKAILTENPDKPIPVAEVSIDILPIGHTNIDETPTKIKINGVDALSYNYTGDGPEFNAIVIDKGKYTYRITSERLTPEAAKIAWSFKFSN